MKRTLLAVLLAALITLLAGVAPVQVAQAAGSTITLIGPPACPPGGCAAGQRLSYQLDFELGAYDATLTVPNVKVCVYIPTNWYDAASVRLGTNGGITNNPYTFIPGTTNCAEDATPPTNYSLAAAGESTFTGIFAFQDSLSFDFRIAAGASAPGSVLVRVFEQTAPGTWTRSSQTFTPQMTPIPSAGVVYVAGDPASCTSSPCYLNSAGDLPGGIGTGLKDAIDAVAAGSRVVVLGTVTLKGNAVRIDKQVDLTGSGDATLTASGGCANPMLEITAGGSLRSLNINDGSCASPDRDLVAVNTPADYTIQSNDLTGGAYAIRVTDNTGSLTVQYNQIRGNSGYALYWDTGGASGRLSMVANNIYQNRAGDQVDCSAGASGAVANRRVDHNYWGAVSAPTASHCTASANKRLGAPILALANAPGVSVARVTVSTTKNYTFSNQVGFQRSADGNDFDIYIVNHGTGSPDAIPFTAASLGSPNPCSNYYDVFLAEGAAPGGSMDLFFKYNSSTACTAAIESSQFCELTTNTAKFPLWWYDPSGQVTAGWDTTGQNPAGSGAGGAAGQATSCDMPNDEIKVTIDTSGRPALNSDLTFTPFMVGIPVPATFITLASNNTVTVRWTTTSEADLSGFYVLRSLNAGGPFDPISDLINRVGSATTGSTYTFVDGGRTNGVINYYRLKIQRTDGTFFYSDILSIVPNVATITPTPTPSQTLTRVPTRSPTVRIPTATRVPTVTRAPTITRVVIATPTVLRSPTRTFVDPLGNLRTATAQAVQGATGYPGQETTATNEPALTGYPVPGETQITSSAASPRPTSTLRKATATLNLTKTAQGVAGEKPRSASDWISLVLGLLMSGGVIFGLAWFFFLRRKA